jgi:predicted nucleic acid-binding protein
MNLVIDSDILIYFLKGHAAIVDKLACYPRQAIFTTRINYTELLYGAYNSSRVEYNLGKITAFLDALPILEFDQKASFIFASDKAQLKRQGILIADMDLMIASIAKANDYAPVTNNLKHFERIEHLRIERWT